MRITDLLRFTVLTLSRQRFRSAMLALSLTLGVASVVILVALGEAARSYVLGEFAFLGSDVIAVFPGRKTTTGALPPVTGVAARDITLREAQIIEKTVVGVEGVAAIVVGSAPASRGSRERNSIVLGVNSEFFAIRQLGLASGSLWPPLALEQSAPVAIIGSKIRDELFSNRRVLGEWLRLRDYRYRVVGILDDSGDSFGMDMSEAVLIPVASAQQLFNVQGLFRMIVRVDPNRPRGQLINAIEARMQQLHDGELDVTVVNPDAMVASLSDILQVMTLAVGGIAAISLLVAGVLVMNLTLISVQQRTSEIGLLKAVGASASQVRGIFISESVVLAVLGIVLGYAVALASIQLGGVLLPDLPLAIPVWALAGVSALTITTAVVFSWRPATQAAALSPVVALGQG